MDDAGGFGAIFAGPPQSVALIEAGLTAVSKAWAAGVGVTVVAVWSSVFARWGQQDASIKVAVVLGAALVTAALVIGLALVFASDVQGRADAAVATIRGWVAVVDAVVSAATKLHEPDTSLLVAWVPLPAPMMVTNLNKAGADEAGWQANSHPAQKDGS